MRIPIPDELSWHPWFAWRPVRIAGQCWVWLERIERVKVANHNVVFAVYYRLPP